MPENADDSFPYDVRAHDRWDQNHVWAAEGTLTTLEYLSECATEEGLRMFLRFDDGREVELTGSVPESLQWLDKNGEQYHVRNLDTVTLEEAAKLIGMSRNALYQRVRRAELRGESTPFRRVFDWFSMLALRAEFLEWTKTFTGSRAVRPKRTPNA